MFVLLMDLHGHKTAHPETNDDRWNEDYDPSPPRKETLSYILIKHQREEHGKEKKYASAHPNFSPTTFDKGRRRCFFGHGILGPEKGNRLE